MADFTISSREHFSLQAAAFRTAAHGLSLGTPGAPASVRRLASALARVAQRHEHATLQGSAQRVVVAADGELAAATAGLLAELESIGRGLDLSVFRLLVVEDDEALRDLLAPALDSPHLQVRFESTLAGARQALRERLYNLVVLDLGLPDGDGRDLLAEIRSDARSESMPVVVLSATGAVEVKEECLALGAEAYYQKPMEPGFLRAALESRLKRGVEVLRSSLRDPLTGLNNRAGLLAAAARLGPGNAPLALALVDLDRFKSVNDTHGHACGDAVLRRVAGLLREGFRDSDLLARWGGEELVALVRRSSPSAAATALGRVLDRLRGEAFAAPSGAVFAVTFSAGVTAASADGLEDALAAADALLYQAKAAGRDRVLCDPGPERP